MQVPVYGCFVVPVNETKLLIGGGFNNNLGNSDKVYTVDTTTGSVSNLTPLSNPGWTVLPPVYFNGGIKLFSCGEESDGFPEEVIYNFTVPL